MKTLLILLVVASSQAYGRISVFPSSVDFFSVRIGGFGESQRVSVRNSGREPARISVSDTCFGDFRVTDSCFVSLRPGSSCSIQVRFQPSREGYQTCNIWLRSSEGGSASVNVSGQGVR